VFKQIAGFIARRVVSWKKQGERVARGERIGLVRFGSRVDVWVPKDAEILVKLGENVKGGSSVLARWPAKTTSMHLKDHQTSEAEAHVSAVGKRN
jgi:phosphatidylserine decarboxylase